MLNLSGVWKCLTIQLCTRTPYKPTRVHKCASDAFLDTSVWKSWWGHCQIQEKALESPLWLWWQSLQALERGPWPDAYLHVCRPWLWTPLVQPETAKADRLIGSWRPPHGLLAGTLTITRLGTCRTAILLSIHPGGPAFPSWEMNTSKVVLRVAVQHSFKRIHEIGSRNISWSHCEYEGGGGC